jgi:hypothetical protein
MIVDNILTFFGTIFLIVIMFKSVVVVRKIDKARKKIERAFLHYPN